MLVTLWRHAAAAMGVDDEARELTDEGRQHLAEAADTFMKWLRREDLPAVDRLLFSPLTRTRQTADILSRHFAPREVEVAACLRPGSSSEEVGDIVSAALERQAALHLVLVSHHPLVANLASLWSDSEAVAPLLPAGFASLEVISPTLGGATLLRHQPDPRKVLV